MKVEIERMNEKPKEITAALLDCVVMPNGEVLCLGKSLGFFSKLKGSLSVIHDEALGGK